ncbi:nucleotidyltransferase domain-containing protein [Myxococcota bacterium]|nr:nucleotidyltransferase domain-containing protein [Myxococcota bacterium]MBU1533775.1 nucleotidyltransferase domain-containing protein [Myxococcota bacterium]
MGAVEHTDSILFNGLRLPTERHLEYLEFLSRQCANLGIGWAVKGSLARGTAREHSDIDLLLFMPKELIIIDDLVEFSEPLMVNFTQRPAGIVMITYAGGLCVELDCREAISQDEYDDVVIISDRNLQIASGEIVRKHVLTKYAGDKPWSMDLRLLYKSLIKYLCHREEAAEGLLREFEEKVQQPAPVTGYSQKAEHLYGLFRHNQSIGEKLDNEIRSLLEKAKQRDSR